MYLLPGELYIGVVTTEGDDDLAKPQRVYRTRAQRIRDAYQGTLDGNSDFAFNFFGRLRRQQSNDMNVSDVFECF